MDDYDAGFVDGQKLVQKELDKLRNLRAVTTEDIRKEELLNNCMNNQKVFDEDGKFIPYSTIVNTIEEHKTLCKHYADRQIKRESNSEDSIDVIEKLREEKKAEREALTDQIVEYNINNGTEVVFLEPRDMYDHAIHGYSREGRVIYSYNEIIQSHVVDDGMTHEEAIEWVEFNTFGTFDHMSNVDWIKDNPQKNPPIFMYED